MIKIKSVPSNFIVFNPEWERIMEQNFQFTPNERNAVLKRIYDWQAGNVNAFTIDDGLEGKYAGILKFVQAELDHINHFNNEKL